MSVPSGENEFLIELEAEVEIELTEVEARQPDEGLPVTDWLFDPTDAEREEIGLRGLRDAIEVLEDDARPGGDVA
ncbi:hypothetical protein [Nonomuraea sp. 10N515B]|uniref:hypothetical protein n=1 Tax=Nonomuraea sp. 10N515B TaxID=3457422 RepID=UPI003FCD6F1E